MESQLLIIKVKLILAWTAVKISVHSDQERSIYFHEREIWWAHVGENIGSEINGKNHRFERPVIVIKSFSKDLLLVVPCTSKPKHGSWYYNWEEDGQIRTAVIQQVKTISGKRLIRRMGKMSPDNFNELTLKLIDCVKNTNPTS